MCGRGTRSRVPLLPCTSDRSGSGPSFFADFRDMLLELRPHFGPRPMQEHTLMSVFDTQNVTGLFAGQAFDVTQDDDLLLESGKAQNRRFEHRSELAVFESPVGRRKWR